MGMERKNIIKLIKENIIKLCPSDQIKVNIENGIFCETIEIYIEEQIHGDIYVYNQTISLDILCKY